MLFVGALVAFIACIANAASMPRPQPYLLFRVRDGHGVVVGTLSASNDFKYFERSRDALDSVTMHAKLLEKTSKGFRFSWSVVQPSRGMQVAYITEERLVTWGRTRFMKSIPGYPVDVFYSRVPANERKDLA
jgi:hypothetical protein